MENRTTRSQSADPAADRGRSASAPISAPRPGLLRRTRTLLFGAPRRLDEQGLFHKVSLVALLAWVGLGADGLSSSAYGPEEAFRTLGQHTYLAIGLAVAMAATVLVISVAYSRVIEHFPHGGGGYVVATKILGERAGLVSGCALLVDYVLTITISVAAAGDALFSFVPVEWHAWKVPAEAVVIVLLTCLNLRGVRESVLVLTPIFMLFILTHLVLIVGGVAAQWSRLPDTLHAAQTGFTNGLATLGAGGMVLLFVHAYSLGGGTYTGIEAVSNGLAIMREPRVRTGKRTMLYMALSLAITASGILLLYLLWGVTSVDGKTMNAVLVERFVQVVPLGQTFVVLTLVAEGALLVVAAQAGFADGPRVLANMALDSWVPRRFASLSDRLTTQNGVVLMGAASLAGLLLTGGDVRYLVVMYSINVFVTFSMTELSMCRLWFRDRRSRKDWSRKIRIHAVGLTMCLTILGVTLYEKFLEGGWITLVITLALILLCVLVRRHYTSVAADLARAFDGLQRLPDAPVAEPAPPDPTRPTAAVLVGGYNGFGIHTTLNVFRAFPNHFKNLVFVSVGVIDSGGFKGDGAVEDLRAQTAQMLDRYVALARRLGVPATSAMAVGTDAVDEAERLCLEVAERFPGAVFVAGQVIFDRETWWRRVLHNQTAYALQRRLQLAGRNMIILPARIRDLR